MTIKWHWIIESLRIFPQNYMYLRISLTTDVQRFVWYALCLAISKKFEIFHFQFGNNDQFNFKQIFLIFKIARCNFFFCELLRGTFIQSLVDIILSAWEAVLWKFKIYKSNKNLVEGTHRKNTTTFHCAEYGRSIMLTFYFPRESYF